MGRKEAGKEGGTDGRTDGGRGERSSRDGGKCSCKHQERVRVADGVSRAGMLTGAEAGRECDESNPMALHAAQQAGTVELERQS